MQEFRAKPVNNNRDRRLAILYLQIISVAIILIIAVAIRLFGGETYNKLSSWYHEKFDDITRTSEVLEPAEKENNELLTVHESSAPEETDKTDAAESGVTGNMPADSSMAVTVSRSVNRFLWPVSGRITSEYGYRDNPITGIYCMHGGIDISANTGTNISAAFDGTVCDSGYSSSYGYFIILDHGKNVQTLYAHCSEICAKKGTAVKQGSTVALVGNTGNSTGSHLHFEIRIGGMRVNPRWLLGSMSEI